MAKYLINTKVDFVAPFFLSGDSRISPPLGSGAKKTFKPAQIVDAFEVMDSGLNKHIVTSDSFDITGSNPKIVGNTIQVGGSIPVNTSKSVSYTVKNDSNIGEQWNDVGLRTPVKITKGQVVSGNTITKFIFNKNTEGIEYKIKSKNMRVGGLDTFFIPLDNLDKTPDSSTDKEKIIEKGDTKKEILTTKNIVIGLVVIGSVFGLLKIAKII